MEEDSILSIRAFAKRIGVSHVTVLNWIKAGRLKAERRSVVGLSTKQLKKVKK